MVVPEGDGEAKTFCFRAATKGHLAGVQGRRAFDTAPALRFRPWLDVADPDAPPAVPKANGSPLFPVGRCSSGRELWRRLSQHAFFQE